MSNNQNLTFIQIQSQEQIHVQVQNQESSQRIDSNTYQHNFEKYKLVVAARNFHYENFNKWLTYFYIANAAMFVALFKIIQSDYAESLTSLICILGTVTGISLFQSSKGYYYWVNHYIKLVFKYEEKLGWENDDLIYRQITLNESERKDYFSLSIANVSSSKIAILLGYTFLITWISLTVYFTLHPYFFLGNFCQFLYVSLFYIILCFFFYCSKSNTARMYNNTLEDENIPDNVKQAEDKIKSQNKIFSIIMLPIIFIVINLSIISLPLPKNKKESKSQIDIPKHNTINFYPKLIINNHYKENKTPKEKEKERTVYFFIKDSITSPNVITKNKY